MDARPGPAKPHWHRGIQDAAVRGIAASTPVGATWWARALTTCYQN